MEILGRNEKLTYQSEVKIISTVKVTARKIGGHEEQYWKEQALEKEVWTWILGKQ